MSAAVRSTAAVSMRLSRAMQNENKHLVLRVFPAGNHDLGNVLEAIRPLPESVSVSIKLTPGTVLAVIPQ